jgi:hypothetical protein
MARKSPILIPKLILFRYSRFSIVNAQVDEQLDSEHFGSLYRNGLMVVKAQQRRVDSSQARQPWCVHCEEEKSPGISAGGIFATTSGRLSARNLLKTKRV